MNLKAVIFDWAGTIIDFGSRAPVRAMYRVFEAEGVPVAEDLVRAFMGMAKREHVISMLKTGDTSERWAKAHGSAWQERDVDRMMDQLEPAMRDAATELSQLIPGAAETVTTLRAQGLKIGSTTGYTRTMMAGILPAAKAQGYEPESLICAGETPLGRPAPYMVWQTLINLSVPRSEAAVKVDDAPVGIEAGKSAGTWTIGLAASGNGLGKDYESYQAMTDKDRSLLLPIAAQPFLDAGANLVIETVAELRGALELIERAIADGQTPDTYSGGFILRPQ